MTGGEAEYYRKRAQEMRERAAQTAHGEIRETMLRIAAEYEKLADHVTWWATHNSN